MSLQQRLNDLVTAIGADVKSLALSSNLPSYAPRGLKNNYDPQLNVYNLKGSNTRHVHAGEVRAQNGSKMHVLALGDSTLIGYDGTAGVCLEWRSIPRVLGKVMAQTLGVPEAGGLTPAGAATGVIMTDKVTVTGTVVTDTGSSTMYAGSTMTFKSDLSGTTAEVYYSDLSSPFTVSIDGAAPVAVTPTGASAMRRYQVTGLTDQPHTIVVSAPTNWVFVTFFAVTKPTGVAVHNISWGGSRASGGGAGVSWMDTSAAANLQSLRKASFDVMSVVPDLVLVCLGGNDIPNGVTPDAVATSLTTIRGWYPNSDFMVMLTMGLNTTTQTAWDAFCARMYTLADTLDIQVVDIRDRTGFATEANSLGYIGADGFHEVQGAMFDWARNISNAYTGAGPSPIGGSLVTSYISSAAPAPTGNGSRNLLLLSALAAGATIANPTGVLVDGNSLIVRIDSPAAQTLAFGSAYLGKGGALALPTTTVAGKTMVLGFMYKASNSKWELQSISQET